jgi:hypothetical protein
MDAMQGFDALRGGFEDGLEGVAGMLRRRAEARSLSHAIALHNNLLDRHRQLIDDYNELVSRHNALVRRVNELEGDD